MDPKPATTSSLLLQKMKLSRGFENTACLVGFSGGCRHLAIGAADKTCAHGIGRRSRHLSNLE
jgi:hypothetical protein